MPKLLKGETGFTLIEAVVSILLLGITVTSMVGVFVINNANAAKTKHYIEAMNHTHAAMEQLKGDLTANPVLPDGDIKDLGGSYSIVISDYVTGVKKVTVTLSWTERLLGAGSSQVSMELVSLVMEQ